MSEVSWRLLFAVALACVALTAWADRTRSDNQIRRSVKAACERGNTTRKNQRAIVNVLLPTARWFVRVDARPEVREYLQTQIPLLERARDRVKLIDCENVTD